MRHSLIAHSAGLGQAHAPKSLQQPVLVSSTSLLADQEAAVVDGPCLFSALPPTKLASEDTKQKREPESSHPGQRQPYHGLSYLLFLSKGYTADMRHAMSNGQERLASHTKDTIITHRPSCRGTSVSSPRRAGWLRYFRCPTQEPSIASFFLGQMGQIPTLRYVLCMYIVNTY